MHLCHRLEANAVFVIFFLLLSNIVLGKDWFVSLSGKDDWSIVGSIDDPFASINRALWSGHAGPDDTIYVRGGTYALTRPVWVSVSGAPGAPLIIRPYQNEKVILDGSNIAEPYPQVFGISRSYVVIEGFNISNSRDIGIGIWPNQTTGAIENVVIRNNVIHDCEKSGIFLGHDLDQTTTGVRDIQITNNILYHNVQENKARSWDSGWHPALGILYSQDVSIDGNHVYENYGEGIAIIRSRLVNVTHNVVHDNYSVNLYIDGGTETRHEANLVYSTGNTEYYRDFYRSPGKSPLPSVGIQIANETCDPSQNYCWTNPIISSYNMIENNIFIANRAALNYGNYDGMGGINSENGLSNMRFAFNSVYGAAESTLQIDESTTHNNSEITNNIFAQIDGLPQTMMFGDISGIGFHHNLWFGGLPQQVAQSSSDLLKNPAFTKPGGYVAADYVLLPGSPAIAAGQTMVGVVEDYCSKIRQSPPTLGAFDSSNVAAVLYPLTLRSLLAGLTTDGLIFYTANLSDWTRIPGQLSQLQAGDLDGDGQVDFAGLTGAGQIFYTNHCTWIRIPGALSKLVAGDFNGDGKADLAGLTGTGQIFYTTNLSTWTHIPGTLAQLVVGDFNGDGKADLAGLTGTGKIFYTTNRATWTHIPGTLAQLVVGDFNGDGKADLAGLTGAGQIFYTTNRATWVNVPGTLAQLRVGDLDGDGKADLAGLTGAGQIFYTTNLGAWINIPGTLTRIRTGDLDGDGRADLAGLTGAGQVFYSTNLSTWRNIPGQLNRLAGDD